MDTTDREGIFINIQRNPFDFGIAAILSEHNRMRGTTAIATEIVFETHKVGEAIPQSAFIPLYTVAEQSLMDDLWRSGVRPSSPLIHAESPKGEIVALNKHLNDMRRIVSVKLEMDLGN